MTAIILPANRVPVQTTVPSNLSIGEIQLSADRRSTKEKPISDSQRIRRVVLPTNVWGNLSASKDGERNQSLTDILREALRKLGNARLSDTLEENPDTKDVALSDYTVAELLRWSEETATSRGSITFTRQDAEEWFTTSNMLTELQVRWTEAGEDASKQASKTAFLKNRIGALAAKNHGIATSKDAKKLLSLLQPEDCESGVGVEILGRLDHIVKALTAKESEATVSMDDL